jgi:hypothetical protein
MPSSSRPTSIALAEGRSCGRHRTGKERKVSRSFKGKINVAIDVSGESYVDLEREAVAMMARE